MSAAPAEDALLHRLSDDALGSLLELSAPLAGALRRCARTAAGLEDVLQNRLGALPDAPGAAARTVLALDDDGMRALSLRAGAVWHARAVLRLLDGTALRLFVSEVGEAPRAAALHWHDLAGVPAATDDTPLAERVARDGWRCLHAWCAAQPPAVARRALPRLPADTVPMDADAARAVRIVEALAGDADG